MTINTTNYRNIEELLDSDDELPMEYNEAPTTPAYENDNRFDMIQFKWINNANIKTSQKQSSIEGSSISTSTDHSEIDSPISNNTDTSYNLPPMILKGVLRKHDLFCLKSIEGYMGDSTFIWLVNFLLQKDLQSNYMFLRSCLISNTLNNVTPDSKYESPREKNLHYNVVIKM